MKMLESKTIEVVEDPEPEPEVDDKSEPGPEVVDELMSLQEEISSQSTKVVELHIEILVDLSAESTMELVSLLAAMRASIFLTSLVVYDPLQIFFSRSQFHSRLVLSY